MNSLLKKLQNFLDFDKVNNGIKKTNQISIDIPNYNGPLEVLLDLAKTQKVDLAEISITKLADQFLEFIKGQENLNLETASEYLLMATWLAYLKSNCYYLKIMMMISEHLKLQKLLQLKKLELIRILSDQMFREKIRCAHFYKRNEGWN